MGIVVADTCRRDRGWNTSFKVEGTQRRLKCPGSRQRHDWEQRSAFVRQALRFVVRGLQHIFYLNSQRHTKAQKHAKNENRGSPSHKGCAS
jgi:hypothetical protein